MDGIPKGAVDRIKRLRQEVARLRVRYHEDDVSEIPDSALDSSEA